MTAYRGLSCLLRRAVRRVWGARFALRAGRGVLRRLPGGWFLYRLARRLASLGRRARPTGPPSRRLCDYLAGQRETPAPASRKRPRVLHYVGSLGGGGAERQLCNLALGSARLGWDVTVVTLNPLTGWAAHYLPLLANGTIDTRQAGLNRDAAFARRFSWNSEVGAVLKRLPPEIGVRTLDLFGEIVACRPDVVHCWMDLTNICGGLAALLAGVPAVVLSTRSVNPSRFPALDTPWYRAWYQLLARQRRVRFINNSSVGARDYAAWLEVPAETFDVVRNGVDLDALSRPEPKALAAFRRTHRIPESAPLIAGVFRYTEEKRPLVWAEVVCRVLEGNPQAHAAVAGGGPMESAMRGRIARAGLQDRCHFLGMMKDMAALYATAHVLLLTSRVEGTPNVLLEAQALGCPVVSTAAGGAVDAVRAGRTGLVAEVDDVGGLTDAIRRLQRDLALRQRFAEAAPRFVRARFGLKRMVQETHDLYAAALASLPQAPRRKSRKQAVGARHESEGRLA
jgi:glycosyltransferase involved in cell wall biosynthesis